MKSTTECSTCNPEAYKEGGNRDKKGLSTIVATLIMILLVCVAVGLIWIVVNNLINEVSPQFNITKEECHEGEFWFNDAEDILYQDSKEYSFTLRGLETIFKGDIAEYLLQDEIFEGDIFWNKHKIGMRYHLIDINGKTYFEKISDYGDRIPISDAKVIEWSEPTNIEIAGKNIRDYEGKITNLNSNLNVIKVNLTKTYYSLDYSIKQVCEQKEVDEIEYEIPLLKCEINVQGCIGYMEGEEDYSYLFGLISKPHINMGTFCPEYIKTELQDNKLIMSGEISFKIIPLENNTYVGILNNDTLVPLNCETEKQIISKESLTTEWLNENAECIERTSKNVEGFIKEEDYQHLKSDCDEGLYNTACEDIPYLKCSKYKCEFDKIYYVEVLK